MKKLFAYLSFALGVVIASAQPTPIGGVTRIVAGTNVTLSPTSGVGAVTINATGGGGGSGTVTTLSVTTANGVSGVVATATTTPAITITLGDITPSSISIGADPADAGDIRLVNAGIIGWEASPAGTDVTLSVNASEQFVFSSSILSPDIVTSITTASTSFTVFAGATTLMTIGGTGASASSFFPSTLDATTSTTGAIRTSGGISAAKAINVGTTLTVAGHVTFEGVTSAGATGTANLVFSTSPTFTTSLLTGSTTFALINTTATTVNFAGGASTALNIGNASGSTAMLGIIGFDGATPSSTTAAIFPAATTAISSVRLPHGTAPTSPVNGDIWTTTAGLNVRVNGSTVLLSSAGSGTVTVVSAGALTSTAIVTGGGSQALQTASATSTMDSSGNMSLAGTLAVGNAGTTAGAISIKQGTTQSTGTTNITIQAPPSVTSYVRTLEGSAGSSGFYFGTVASTTVTDSKVASTGSGNVVLGTSPDFVTSVTTASTSFTAWAGATTLLTFGGTGASASTFFPSTLDTTSSTTGAIRTSGGISAAKAGNIGTTLSVGSTIELGAATDTTLSRSTAGVIAVEGNIVSMVGPRITSITSSATPTFDVRTCDVVNITALATAITSMTTSGTFTGILDGQFLEFRILDNGTARAISWGASFASGGATLPTTTILGKALSVYFEYDAVQAKLMCNSTFSYP